MFGYVGCEEQVSRSSGTGLKVPGTVAAGLVGSLGVCPRGGWRLGCSDCGGCGGYTRGFGYTGCKEQLSGFRGASLKVTGTSATGLMAALGVCTLGLLAVRL